MTDTDPVSVHDDIWFFDCRTRRWLPPSSPSHGQSPELLPAARYAHLSAVSRGKLVISGGQHADNSWVYEINVYDLEACRWTSKTSQPEAQGAHSKGAYRSVAVSSKQRAIMPKSGESKTSFTHSYSIDEDGEGGQIWCYSNYDFAKVRRELDVFTASDEVIQIPPASTKHTSPPCFFIDDQSSRLGGATMPPGLRFPTGGIVGNYFILCGLYLASTSAAFSVWSLDLTTKQWRHLEPAVLNTGSWNRAVVWPEQAKLLVFGNSGFDLASDYGRRAVNLDHIAVISLEAFGIYRPPKLEVAPKVQQNGLVALDEQLASDFEVICEDGRKVKCSRQMLAERWPWFAAEQQALSDRLTNVVGEAPSLDIADTLLGSFTPARLAPTHLNMPEPFPVCVALVQYFYTLSLSTALQNRAPVLSALLFLAKQYKIDRLARLVVHALHERLEPSIAVGIYEIATLAGEQSLQVRALRMVHSTKADFVSPVARPSASGGHFGEGRRFSGPGEGSTGTGSAGPAPTASQPGSQGAASAPTHSRPTGNHVRVARPESVTLGAKEVAEVDDLIAALSVNASEAVVLPSPTTSRSQSPAPQQALKPRRSLSRPTPVIGPPPSSRMFRSYGVPALQMPDMPPPDLVRSTSGAPSSPTNSDWTSPVPATPSESVRESFILPPDHRNSGLDSWTMDSRSSSSSGYGLGLGLTPVPEDGRGLARFKNFSRYDSPKRGDNTLAVNDELQRGPPRLSSAQAQHLSSPFTTMDPFQPAPRMNKHNSISTTSSIYSTSSLKQDLRMFTPSSPVLTEFDYEGQSKKDAPASKNTLLVDCHDESRIHSSQSPQKKSQTASSTYSQSVDYAPSVNYAASTTYAPSTMASSTTCDGSSVYSGNSGSSSKKAAKAERKA